MEWTPGEKTCRWNRSLDVEGNSGFGYRRWWGVGVLDKVVTSYQNICINWFSRVRMSPKWSCYCKTMPRLAGHLQPRRKFVRPVTSTQVFLCFPVSISKRSDPILRIWPHQATTCSLDRKEKIIEISPFFFRRGGYCCRGDLIGRTASWIFIFEWLVKVTAMG